MKCPRCQVKMLAGRTLIQSTLLGAFICGLSRDHLWFEADESGGKEMVMRLKTWCRARRCPECVTLVIPFEGDE